MKCPYCGSEKMDCVNPVTGNKYAIFEIDTEAGKRCPNALTVDIYGCPDCGGVFLKSEFVSEE